MSVPAADPIAQAIAVLPEATLVVAGDGVIRSVNARAAGIFGASAMQLVGRRLDHYTAEDAQAVTDYLRLCSRSTRLVPGALTLRRGGTPLRYRCEGALLQARSGEAPALLLVRLTPREAAVTRFVALNLRIEELAKEIARRQRAESELRTLSERKDEFLAMLAHELRNPLAVLTSSVEVIRARAGGRAAVDPVVAQLSQAMQRQTRQLARLVNDFLDVSRITTGKIALRKAAVTLNAVLQHAIEMARPALEARAVSLDVRAATATLSVEADVERLAQVFANLLTNAAKFSARGARVVLESAREGGDAVVKVRDSGAGIAPQMLGAIFELFVQADTSLARSQGGLGVGLTIAKLITDLHGGSIEAHSEGLERGSEFVVRLPLAEGSALATRQPASAAPRGAARRILVVDDNPDAAWSLASILELLEHQVRIAHDGPAALELAGAFQPELVLLDIGLPGMDGYEVARRLRQRAGMQSVRLVAISGYGRDSDRSAASAAGFDHHLTKPVTIESLEALIVGAAP